MLADRAEEHAAKGPVPSTANHQQGGVGRSGNEHRSGMTLHNSGGYLGPRMIAEDFADRIGEHPGRIRPEVITARCHHRRSVGHNGDLPRRNCVERCSGQVRLASGPTQGIFGRLGAVYTNHDPILRGPASNVCHGLLFSNTGIHGRFGDQLRLVPEVKHAVGQPGQWSKTLFEGTFGPTPRIVRRLRGQLDVATTDAFVESSRDKAALLMTVRVFLLDDHELVRRGVRDLLGNEEDLEVVGEAATADEALIRIPSTRPDVALLDVRLGGNADSSSGIEVCRDIRSAHPGVACLMLTSFADDEALFASIMAGAAGYLLKQVQGNDLVGALRRVAGGESLLDPAVTARVLDRLRNPQKESDPLADLSPQERRILLLISQGMTNRQIAGEMYLAEKTIKNYVSRLLVKLGMAHRSEAAAYAARISERQQPQRDRR